MYPRVMEEPYDRLRKLRIQRGFSTAAEAAAAHGWNPDTYKSHENGIRGIRPPVAKKYASAFNSTAGYIMTGPEGQNHGPTGTIVHVPVIARVSAGAFRYDEGIEEGTIQVPAIPRRGVPAALQYSVVVEGSSVNRRIPDGAYAICAPYENFPGGAQHGQLVHVIRERAGLHEHTIKELRYTASGAILMPVSDDPRYQDAVKLSSGDDGEVVRIQGVVIGAYVPF